MKYNKSKIMSRAWSIRRITGCTMSTALKQAWAEAKKPSFYVKDWFMKKEFTRHERFAIDDAEPELVCETEKAVKLRWPTDYGAIVRWVPKSCLYTAEQLAEEIAAENTPEKIEERRREAQEREDRYNDMITECRAKGIPARKGWRVATMKAKLAEIA